MMIEVPETHQPTDSNNTDGRIYVDYLLPISNKKNQDGDTNKEEKSTSYLRCLLISDINIDKSGASMCINVGQMNDPIIGHGIAHLTEHMLFMGSTDYPEENEYDTYLSQSNGYHNAYTDLECTNYHFECSNTSFDGALHRFAAGFTSPLLTVSTIEREVNAVDSEHGNYKQQDTWRTHQLSRTIIGKSFPIINSDNNTTETHPYGSFGTGSKVTLLGDVKESAEEKSSEDSDIDKTKRVLFLQQNVTTFYQRYYKAENMTLCILSNQSIESMKSLVDQYFSHIPTIDNPEYNIPRPLPLIQDFHTSSTKEEVTTTNKENHPLPIIIEVVPMKRESQSIELQWILPEQHTLYLSKPLHCISHILGHEGPGSLLSILREYQYVQELYSDDSSKSTETFCIFTLHLELTDYGLEHIQIVISIVFYYIRNVLPKELPKWVYDELQITGNTTFRFLSKHGAGDTCTSLSTQMQLYSIEHYLSGPYKMYEYNPKAIQNIIEYLSNNMNYLLIIISSIQYDNKTNEIDPNYDTNYRIIRYNNKDSSDGDDDIMNKNNNDESWNILDNLIHSKIDVIDEIKQKLKLPEQNDMLPSQFDLISKDEATVFYKDTPIPIIEDINRLDMLPPKCLIDNDVCRLWYKPDTASFQTPKVNVLMFLRTYQCNDSPKHNVLGTIYAEILTEICNEFAYAASMAGLHCGFINTSKSYGLEIHVSGYNHKVITLLQRICHAMLHELPSKFIHTDTENDNDITKRNEKMETANALFDRVRDKIEEQYASVLVGQPYQYGSYVADLCLETGTSSYTIQERIEYIQEVTIYEFINFIQTILNRFQLELLIHGNVTSIEAIEYTNTLLQSFQPKPPLYIMSTNRAIQIPNNNIECIYRLNGFNEENDNNCILNIYQIGKVNHLPKLNTTLLIINQLIREPAFNTLRTEEQLGYVVFTNIKTNSDDIKSLLILIQSNTYDPIYMNKRIELFLLSFRTKIMNMSNDDYIKNIQTVYESIIEKNKNLMEESSKHWQVINGQTYRYNRYIEIATILKNTNNSITKDDIISFIDQYISYESIHRRKLSIQIFGSKHSSLLLSKTDTEVEKEEAVNEKEIEKEKVEEGVETEKVEEVVSKTKKIIMMIDNPKEFVRTHELYPLSPSVSIESFMTTTSTSTTGEN